MKRNIGQLFGFFLLIVVLLSVSACKQADNTLAVPGLNIPCAGSVANNVNYQIEISKASALAPVNAELYRFTAPQSYEDVLKKLEDVFGDIQEKRVFDSFILITGEKAVLDYEPDTGTWSYQNTAYRKDSLGELPSDEKSVQITRAFLVDHNLNNETFSDETVVTQYSGSKLDDSYSPYCKAVYFYPVINGCPVLGVSRIIVNVGVDGEIMAVMKYYKEYESCGTIALASPMGFADGIKREQYSTSISEQAVSAKITDVKLAYWEDAGSSREQPYLQPVWVFTGTATRSDGLEEKFDVIVQAAKYVEGELKKDGAMVTPQAAHTPENG